MAKAKDDMIRFRCHRCKKRIAAPQGNVGKKVKCPGCQIVTIVPDVPSAETVSKHRVPPRTGVGAEPTLQAPPPSPPVAPMDDLSQLATATVDEQYETYDQPSHYAEPERARGPRIKRSHLQWIGALSMSLHALWILTLGTSIWLFVSFAVYWNDMNDLQQEIPGQVIVFAFLAFFISLVFCFCCLTGAMACGMVRTMGRKMNTL